MDKYLTEFALNMHQTHVMVLQDEHLTSDEVFEYFTDDHPCHIYYICRRPRIMIDTSAIVVHDKSIVIPFHTEVRGQRETFSVELPNQFPGRTLRFESEFPHSSFKLFVDNELFLDAKTGLWLQGIGHSFSGRLDLEVLYIGQSFGEDGERTAPDRLISHSTLQKVYADALRRNPDQEIWIVLTSFERYLIQVSNPKQSTVDAQTRDLEHRNQVLRAVFENELSEKQVINFTEAALIRYFQPPYNTEYKNTFPKPSHTSYNQCYDLDLHTIYLELNTESSHLVVYSAKARPLDRHIEKFELHSREDRVALFDF